MPLYVVSTLLLLTVFSGTLCNGQDHTTSKSDDTTSSFASITGPDVRKCDDTSQYAAALMTLEETGDNLDDVSRNTSDIVNNSMSCVASDDNKNTSTVSGESGSVKVNPVFTIDQGIVSRAQYEMGEMVCRYLFYVLLASAVCVNVINIVVYTDPSMKGPTSTYLIALSVNELLFSSLSMLRPILKGVYGVDAVKKEVYLLASLYGSIFLLSTLRRLMYCFTLLVSTERFLAVAFPFKARHFRLINSPKLFIIVISAVCLLCHLPNTLGFEVVRKPNSTDYTIGKSNFYWKNKDFVFASSLANKIVYAYIILMVGLTMNLCVLIALRMHNKNRQKMKTSVNERKAAKRERQTTITILASTFCFTILGVSLATDSIVRAYLPRYNLYRKEHYMYLLMKEVNAVLIMLSLSTDFIFYMILSKAFRRTFIKRIPFMATIFIRQKYHQDSTENPETKMSTIS